jgi:hypothetical protein
MTSRLLYALLFFSCIISFRPQRMRLVHCVVWVNALGISDNNRVKMSGSRYYWPAHTLCCRQTCQRRQETLLVHIFRKWTATLPSRRRRYFAVKLLIIYFYRLNLLCKSRVSSLVIVTRYVLDGPVIESLWGRDFPHLSRPAPRPTQPPIQWVPGLSRGKAPVAWRPPNPFSAEVKERVELYIYSSSGLSWSVLEWTLPLPLPLPYSLYWGVYIVNPKVRDLRLTMKLQLVFYCHVIILWHVDDDVPGGRNV